MIKEIKTITASRNELDHEIKKRKKIAEKLNNTLHLLNDAEVIGHSGSWSRNLLTGEEFWSKGMFFIYGIPDDSLSTQELHLQVIHSEDRDVYLNLMNETLTSNKNHFSYDFRIQKSYNQIRHIHSDYEIIRDTSGKAILLKCTNKDITAQRAAADIIKASLKEKETLLFEIHHRVKNNMQIISSLLSLQSDAINDEKSKKVLKESQNRVLAMASIHENLYRSKDFASIDLCSFVSELVGMIQSSYQLVSGKVIFEVDSEKISINTKQASPLALVINELVTNSFKYAFSDGRQGKIDIKISREKGGNIHISFSDNGIGIPQSLDWRNSATLGLKLVVRLIENQLEGSINMEINEGTHFFITFKDDLKTGRENVE